MADAELIERFLRSVREYRRISDDIRARVAAHQYVGSDFMIPGYKYELMQNAMTELLRVDVNG